MKSKRLFAKMFASVAVVAVLATSAALLFACNKKNPALDDIFKSASSEAEFSGYRTELTLPTGWITTPTAKTDAADYVNSSKSDVGYVKALNAFVVLHKGTGSLSIIKCSDDRVYFEGGAKGMLFPYTLGITALRVKDGLIACKFNDGRAAVFDYTANTVISRENFKNTISSINIDDAVKILDGEMVAVHHSYEKTGEKGYTSIFRPTRVGAISERGELVCRVANSDNALKNVLGFDGKYVTVVGNKAGDAIFRIPGAAGGEPANMTGSANGTVAGDGQDDYYSEITYIGGGRFFIHEDWTVASDKDYMYYDGYDYYVFDRHIYTPDNDKLVKYTANSDKVFAYMSNNYYGSDKAGIDTSSYLNDGYIYASYGLSIEGKAGFYDQFILDSDLNIVMSLTGNYGVTIKDQKKEKVSVYDLIMTKVDGYYYMPIAPSEFNIYDGAGTLVGHNDRSNILQQELSNNVIVAAIKNPDDEDEVLYGAYNIYGEEIIPFEYTSLSAFRGSYTIGEKIDKDRNRTMCIIGIDGKEITQLSDGTMDYLKGDIATTSSGAAIYKIGCYMYKEKIDNTTYYGVKNFNPNVEKNIVIPATMASGSTLYAPSSSPSDVFVFEKITSGTNVTYTIYRLI